MRILGACMAYIRRGRHRGPSRVMPPFIPRVPRSCQSPKLGTSLLIRKMTSLLTSPRNFCCTSIRSSSPVSPESFSGIHRLVTIPSNSKTPSRSKETTTKHPFARNCSFQSLSVQFSSKSSSFDSISARSYFQFPKSANFIQNIRT